MYFNKANIPYNLPASGMWYSYITQALTNMLPKWMEIRDNPQSVGQQFLSPPAMALHQLNEEVFRMHMNKYLSTADLIEPDLVYKIYLDRDSELNLADLTVVSALDDTILTRVENINDLFLTLPTRIESTNNSAPAPSDLIINDTINDPTYVKIEKWVPDNTSPYEEMRPIDWKVEDEKVQMIDRINPAEIYNEYTLANGAATVPTGATPVDLAFFREYLWVLLEASGVYSVAAVNRYTELPDPGSLTVEAVLPLPTGIDSPTGIDNDASGFFWVVDSSGIYHQLKLVHDYYWLDKDIWVLYVREPYANGIIIT